MHGGSSLLWICLQITQSKWNSLQLTISAEMENIRLDYLLWSPPFDLKAVHAWSKVHMRKRRSTTAISWAAPSTVVLLGGWTWCDASWFQHMWREYHYLLDQKIATAFRNLACQLKNWAHGGFISLFRTILQNWKIKAHCKQTRSTSPK